MQKLKDGRDLDALGKEKKKKKVSGSGEEWIEEPARSINEEYNLAQIMQVLVGCGTEFEFFI